MRIASTEPSYRMTLVTAGVCAAILILFSLLTCRAARSKSATVDEPLHLVAGFVHRTSGDFRIDPEQPALFGYWASLPLGDHAIDPAYDMPRWELMLQDHNLHQWDFATATLSRIDPAKFDGLIQRSRLMFVPLGIALGALIAWWSWQTVGAWAAVIATMFFALDPNFLGHTPLIKNDVPFALALFSTVLATWRFGRRGTWRSLTAIGLGCAAAVNLKFSGVICGPILVLLLLIRASLPLPWNVVGMQLASTWQRLLVVPAAAGIVGIAAYVSIWACYQWRFAPTDKPGVLLNSGRVLAATELTGTLSTMIMWAESKHLLPQAWLFGLLYTRRTMLGTGAYLMGHYTATGWWYYFPCAMLFKTPTATLVAIPAAVVAALTAYVLRRRAARLGTSKNTPTGAMQEDFTRSWMIACLTVPVLVYALASLSSRLNIGVRHMLAIYPFVFVILGVLLADFIRRYHRIGMVGVGALLLALSIESLVVYPDYIAFFNFPSAARQRGLHLLGDSNLDWGQDLKLLARWQQQHAEKKLYLCYFGTSDPAWYGVRADSLPGGWPYLDPPPPLPAAQEPSYMAVSATHLLGIYYPAESRGLYKSLLDFRPIAVLGGTIYIYELPLRTEDKSRTDQ